MAIAGARRSGGPGRRGYRFGGCPPSARRAPCAGHVPRRLADAQTGLGSRHRGCGDGDRWSTGLRRTEDTIRPLALLGIEGLVPLGAAWFVGDAVAARRRYERGLREQAEREQVADAERARKHVREERVRIAQELHDVVAHTLAVITVQAGVGRRLMAKRPEEASNALESIEAIGRTAQEELRVVLDLLREEGDVTYELSPAPRLMDLKQLVETVRASGTDVELHMTVSDGQLSPALELSLYRVVQEALTNVVETRARCGGGGPGDHF